MILVMDAAAVRGLGIECLTPKHFVRLGLRVSFNFKGLDPSRTLGLREATRSSLLAA